MEKRSYVKPEFKFDEIKLNPFMIASGEDGGGGTSCTDPISETIMENLLRVNTDYSGWGDGPFNLGCFKQYLQENPGGKVLYADFTSTEGTEVTVTGSGRNEKTYASVGGLSFQKGQCYKVTLVSGCLHFDHYGTCSGNDYNISTPCGNNN